MMRQFDDPAQRASVTKSCCFSASTSTRTWRAVGGQIKSVMIRITLRKLGPKITAIRIARRNAGNAIRMSTVLMISESQIPPKKTGHQPQADTDQCLEHQDHHDDRDRDSSAVDDAAQLVPPVDVRSQREACRAAVKERWLEAVLQLPVPLAVRGEERREDRDEDQADHDRERERRQDRHRESRTARRPSSPEPGRNSLFAVTHRSSRVVLRRLVLDLRVEVRRRGCRRSGSRISPTS